jgi:hypothetical protein
MLDKLINEGGDDMIGFDYPTLSPFLQTGVLTRHGTFACLAARRNQQASGDLADRLTSTLKAHHKGTKVVHGADEDAPKHDPQPQGG